MIKDITQASVSVDNQKTSQEKLKKTCQDFESIFLTYMLKTMRAGVTESGLTDKSHESNMIYAMYDEKLSEEMAGNGGMGLANMLFEQLKDRK
ncbi:MAG: rod-binding protein [Proteobacteria bacterium]|nr:rod-binding protein [Pseudomonadota bacterium]MBU4009236.1 rod-binding protein [Pseudomonadota bacterium]